MEKYIDDKRKKANIWSANKVISNVIIAIVSIVITGGLALYSTSLKARMYFTVYGGFAIICILILIGIFATSYKVIIGGYLYEKDGVNSFKFAPTTKVSGWILTFYPCCCINTNLTQWEGIRTLQFILSQDQRDFERWISARMVEEHVDENRWILSNDYIQISAGP